MESKIMLQIATLGFLLCLSFARGGAPAAAGGAAADAGGAAAAAGGAAAAAGGAPAAAGGAPAAAGGAPAATGGAGGVFDITKYGATPNSDITQAWTKAWTEACASPTPSKIVIPKGTYKLVQVKFEGPCKSPSIEMQVDATITAPQDPAQLKASESWITFSRFDGLTLTGSGTFDGQGPKTWTTNNCHVDKNCKLTSMNFSFNFLKNAMIKGVTTKDSKNFHVNVLGCTNITFSQFTVVAPDESPNTDGIHIGRSLGVNIIDSKIGTGDDCISIGDGAKQVKVTGVTCGPGHGISVGSLGKYDFEEPVEGLFITNCTLKGTDNGVRIKTWPNNPKVGTATDMHFEDIIMDNVKNPVLVDQEYCPWNQCDKAKPSTIKLSKISFKNIRGTSATPLSVTIACSKAVPCEGVEIADIDLTFNGGPSKSVCDNVAPSITGKQNPAICAEKASAEAAAMAAVASEKGAEMGKLAAATGKPATA